MREREIEANFVRKIKAAGGWAVKFVSPGCAGMPDRLVLLPDGRLFFAELKAPGERPRPLQMRRHEQLRRLGFRVYVIDNLEKAREVIEHELHTT